MRCCTLLVGIRVGLAVRLWIGDDGLLRCGDEDGGGNEVSSPTWNTGLRSAQWGGTVEGGGIVKS